MQRYIMSKWAKTEALLPSESIKTYIPLTKRLTPDNLQGMLDQLGMVYVKPDRGTYGGGVMRVDRNGGQDRLPFQYQLGTRKRRFATFDALYKSIRRSTGKRRYLVQKGIHLLKHNGRRFDLRIMVQHNLQNKWETTGIIGRAAHPSKIVTNFHNGGKLVPANVLMSSHAGSDEKLGKFLNKLETLGVDVGEMLNKRYPGIREIGIDVGVDSDLKPWILEVNTSPDPFIFRRLSDKAIFRRIMRYARGYGKYR